MGYTAAVQILTQAEELKLKIMRKYDLLTDSQGWIDQQKLQTIYHKALIHDLEYSLDKKVEQDLWNIGFKTSITNLQELIRDKKNIKRSDYQALLTWWLETASGFYINLLQELCNVFDIDLPFRKPGHFYGQINCIQMKNLPKSTSRLYICQYCLVHLGDIARYRNQRKQAENFYKEAIIVSPTSGHPYNQLALLEASQGNKLSTVFYYIRGISLKNPFPASTTNLLNTLNSTIDKESPLEKVQTKMTVNEFIQIFLSTHALLHTTTDLNQAKIGVESLNSTMTALVATQSFTTDKLIKITAINLYALNYIMQSIILNDKTDIELLTEDEKQARELILDLLAGSLSAFLVPVHTLKNDESLLNYYALPAVKILAYWIQNEPDVLNETVFGNRLQIWPSLCKLLNTIQDYLKNFDYKKYSSTALLEDKVLEGFNPLLKSFQNFDFKLNAFDNEKLIRASRLVQFGSFLTEISVNNTKLILKNQESDKIVFTPGCMQPDPTNDLLEEMKSFNTVEVPTIADKKCLEKRVGILKPQGSLEKSREERELLSLNDVSSSPNDPNIQNSNTSTVNTKTEAVKLKRSKQNVALQSIYKKLEENKQVKFNVDSEKKEKLVTFDAKPLPKPLPSTSTTPNQYNMPLRPQKMYNQNLPPYPNPQILPNQPDYLNNLRTMQKPQIEHYQTKNFQMFPNNKNDLTPAQHIPFPNFPSNPAPNLLNTNKTNSMINYDQMPPNSIQSHVLLPYQNLQFPSQSNSYRNNMKMDEVPPNSWWQNSSNNANNYQRTNDFQPMNYSSYSNNLAPLNGGPFMQKTPTDYNKSAQINQSCNNDGFGSHWNQDGRNNFGINDLGYDSNGSNVSIRQAMLKEAVNPNMNPSNNRVMNNHLQNTPGYSLFNTNSWSPNLVGQLRNNKTPQENSLNHMPQQSLFTGQGPQSLAQLLEQQQSQRK